MDLPPGIQRKLVVLKSKRTGKKVSITKRIKQLAGMVEAGGCSRKLMQDMMGKLTAVYEELETVCEEISQLSELHDVSDLNNDIEDIRFNVDSCIAEVTDHIESRQDEAPSSGSMRTLSWVANLPIPESELGNSDVNRTNVNRSGDLSPGPSISLSLSDLGNSDPVSHSLPVLGASSAGLSDVPITNFGVNVSKDIQPSNVTTRPLESSEEYTNVTFSGNTGMNTNISKVTPLSCVSSPELVTLGSVIEWTHVNENEYDQNVIPQSEISIAGYSASNVRSNLVSSAAPGSGGLVSTYSGPNVDTAENFRTHSTSTGLLTSVSPVESVALPNAHSNLLETPAPGLLTNYNDFEIRGDFNADNLCSEGNGSVKQNVQFGQTNKTVTFQVSPPDCDPDPTSGAATSGPVDFPALTSSTAHGHRSGENIDSTQVICSDPYFDPFSKEPPWKPPGKHVSLSYHFEGLTPSSKGMVFNPSAKPFSPWSEHEPGAIGGPLKSSFPKEASGDMFCEGKLSGNPAAGAPVHSSLLGRIKPGAGIEGTNNFLSGEGGLKAHPEDEDLPNPVYNANISAEALKVVKMASLKPDPNDNRDANAGVIISVTSEEQAHVVPKGNPLDTVTAETPSTLIPSSLDAMSLSVSTSITTSLIGRAVASAGPRGPDVRRRTDGGSGVVEVRKNTNAGGDSMDKDRNKKLLNAKMGMDIGDGESWKVGCLDEFEDEILRVSSSRFTNRDTLMSSSVSSSNFVSSLFTHSARPLDISTIYSTCPRLQPIPHPVIKPSSLGLLPSSREIGDDTFSVWRDNSIIVSPTSSSNTSRGCVSPPLSRRTATDDVLGSLATKLEATNMGLEDRSTTTSRMSGMKVTSSVSAVANEANEFPRNIDAVSKPTDRVHGSVRSGEEKNTAAVSAVNGGDQQSECAGSASQPAQVSNNPLRKQIEEKLLREKRLEESILEEHRLKEQHQHEQCLIDQLEHEKHLQKLRLQKIQEEQIRQDQARDEQFRKLHDEQLRKEQLLRKELEREKFERQKLERERLEREKLERERLEQDKLELERLEQDKLERERLERDKLERERLAHQQKLEHKKLAIERLERERLDREKHERDLLECERLELEKLEREKLQREKFKRDKLEREKLEREKLEHERLEREKLEQERLERGRRAPRYFASSGAPPTRPASYPASRNGSHTSEANDVDAWIDELDDSDVGEASLIADDGINTNAMVGWMVQQYLPKMELPTFNGSAREWVDFIVKFRDIVHKQQYLSNFQKNILLLQHLKGEAHRSVKAFGNNPRGYVWSLKKLKHLFGQRSAVARAVLEKATKGKPILNDDLKALTELYYSVSECLTVLNQLNYESDLKSSDTLRQVLQRLPRSLQMKWGEHSLVIKRYEEPDLTHLEEWLHARVLARKEANLTAKKEEKKKEKRDGGTQFTNTMSEGESCQLCSGSHNFWRCRKYRMLSPKKKWECVKDLRLCFNCFRSGHMTQQCTSDNKCLKPECRKKHHTSLHTYYTEGGESSRKPSKDGKDKSKQGSQKDSKKKTEEPEVEVVAAVTEKEGETEATMLTTIAEKSNEKEDETESTLASISNQKKVFLQIVPMILHGNGGKYLKTYGILDACSHITLIREEVAWNLGLSHKEKDTSLGTVEKVKAEVVREVSLKVSSTDGKKEFTIESAYMRSPDRFNMPARPSFTDATDAYKHLEGIEFDAVSPKNISILIGANCAQAVLMTDVRFGSLNQPLAVNTPFGWTLFGPSLTKKMPLPAVSEEINLALQCLWEEEEKAPTEFVNLITTDVDLSLQASVERFWKQEHVGILPVRDIAMSREDVDDMEKLQKETVLLKNGKYQVPMLWNKKMKKLPKNRPMALKRYFLLQRRLLKDNTMFQSMNKVIQGYLSENPPHARKLTPEEAEASTPRTWHLPTHPVVNPNKPGKVRVVNDAAAVYQGESLNNSLRSGPDLLSSLVGVLMRFRNGKVALAADVEAMFHQVRVSPEDADSLRFLWKEDIHADGPPDTYQMLVHIFGAKDSPACANYTLKRIARDNFKNFDASTVETVLKNFYVDDLLKSLHSVDAAIKLSKELIAMLQRGGFRLTKFLSSHKDVLDAIPESEISPSATLDLDVEQLERALGISWDTANDVFTFIEKLKQNPPTKLGILSTSSSLFDPLGFLTPFLLVARLLLQDLWRLGYDWDTEIEGKLLDVWQKWLQGVKHVPSIRLPRRYVLTDESIHSIQLHVFCDASESAYGCVAYLRFTLKSGKHECSFVMSKSRLAPLKTITLPRLELNAARAGARISRLIVHEIDLPIGKVFYWSDSTIVLQYIHNDKKRVKVFVANRVTEILELSDTGQWFHVKGSENPADVLSRGVMDPRKLMKEDWFPGPSMLYEDEDSWESIIVGELDDDDPEVKKKSLVSSFVLMLTTGALKVQNYSNWIRAKRVAAWLIRWCSNARKEKGLRSGPIDLQVEELNSGELVLVRDAQQIFDDEIQLIKTGKELLESSKLIALSPFLDSVGILRVGGRLRYIPIPTEAKHPAILPRDHAITRLLIDWLHRRNGHVGREHVLSLLKEKYWVLSARVAINTAIRLCFFCKIRRAKRHLPKMADLPEGRAAIEEPPFTHCGVDLAGPVLVKEGRKRLKRWIVLFTCLTVRCVHLEIVETVETDAFLNSMRRFTNRRGCPSTMYSDRGSNFRGATSELKEFISNLDQFKINNFTASLNIKWKFNPPKAPHMGGIWERMVRSVKEVLSGILKEHVLTDSQLYTALTEVENIINSRPLTHVSEDPADLEAITPNHLLLGRHLNWGAIINTDAKDVFSRKKWKQVQGIRAVFWERWRKEYLPTLTKRSRWRKKAQSFEVGELVLLRDDDQVKRGKWPLARITKVMPGRDHIIRTVELKTKDGDYTRPVSSLYKLENNIGDVRQGAECVTDETDADHSSRNLRPRANQGDSE